LKGVTVLVKMGNVVLQRANKGSALTND